jgi:hypothetical protein
MTHAHDAHHAMHRPSRWPHLVIEAGPSIAGVEVGDMLPIDVGAIVSLLLHRWSPFPAMQPSPVSRPALYVRAAGRADHNGPAWRVLEHPVRVERTETAMVPESWQVDEPSVTSVRGPRGVPAHISKWGVRFVVDGPPLGTVRTFGEHVACRPRLLGTVEEGTLARSEWLVAKGGAREVLLVDQTFDGALTWRTVPRQAGVNIEQLRRAVPHEPKVIDKEIAAGIVAQMGATQGATLLGWDGVARPIAPPRGAIQDARVHAFLLMTRDSPYDLDDDLVEPAAAELATIRPASVHEIAAVMRSLFPEAAAREAAIVEECAVLAG